MFIYFRWRREKFGKAETLSESSYEVIQILNIHNFLDWMLPTVRNAGVDHSAKLLVWIQERNAELGD